MDNYTVQETAELAVRLNRLYGIQPFRCAKAALEFMKLANRAHRLAERLCSDATLSENEHDKKTKALYRAFERVAAVFYGDFFILEKLKVEFGGDPRGCCMRLFHSELPKNGMGEGYAL